MELDDFKNTWSDMSQKVKINQDYNLKKFDKMNQSKSQSNINKIILTEILGTIVCIGAAIFTAVNFSKLEPIAYQFVGILTILILLILSMLSFMSILPLFKVVDLNKSYVETLKDFANKKRNFFKLQKWNQLLSYGLLVTVILLSTRLFGRNEITESKYFFVFAFTLGYAFFLVFSSWVAKKYKINIQTTEELLKELAA